MRIATRMTAASALAWMVFSAAAPQALAQAGIYAYPQQGQSPQQQQQDQAECHRWAVSQTGFDPVNTPRPSSGSYASAPRSSNKGVLGVGGDKNLVGGDGNVLSDAATGAAFGAIGGAIAGDAGTGALVGSAVSAVFGGIVRSSRQNEDEKWRRDQEAQRAREQQVAEQRYQEQMSGYRQAYGSCMSARYYQIQ